MLKTNVLAYIVEGGRLHSSNIHKGGINMPYLVAVDSGHGMETAGKRTPPLPENWYGKKKGDSIREKEFNKPTSEFLIEALTRCGFSTLNISPGTKDISLKGRYDAANQAKADILVSKHYNAHTGTWGAANGIETIVSQYAKENTKKLAAFIQEELVRTHLRTDRGVKTDIQQSGINLAILRNAAMPAVLTESGFMDNLAEAKTMLDVNFQTADAEATCKGICRYFNVPYIKEIIIPTQTITKGATPQDIKWLQEKLNQSLSEKNYVLPLQVDGVYGNKTRIAVLIYWEVLGWNKEGKDDGWKAGKKTIDSLSKLK